MLTVAFREKACTPTGKALVAKNLASLERERHARVISLLERALAEVPLTPEVAREVFAEMEARRELLQCACAMWSAAKDKAWTLRHRARGAAARARA